ncbi:hypothetical protein ADL15_40630 [Actinoplanes awajinensis subsp. mycoplanecinus]|uniref:Uncharacterized protein n=2 Tax=Actinoplanes awajinensis TaxID=135946 RepID=A0A101JET5_9ACTN|nr:hypothetical protein ADL15_40630 [Actinoplanes awajinensis subsp. mycoplanecinus]
MAEARLTDDSAGASLALHALMPLASDHPTRTVIVAVDAVADAVVEWSDELGKNPACMAETCFTMLHGQLAPPERLLLFAAYQTLLAIDPTGEAGSPHQVCHPWPPHAGVASLATAAQGGVLQQALTAASQTHGLEQHPALVLCNAAPEVLTQILWGRSRSDPEQMGRLLAAKKNLA